MVTSKFRQKEKFKSKNRQIPISGFQFVAKNMKG
jgi:hypothetical protein